MTQLPWSSVKTENIRAVVRDIGLARYTAGCTRSELLKILHDVETDGVEAVVQDLEDRQIAADRLQSPVFSYAPDRRDESPELEYHGPPPSAPSASRLVPVVEIASPPTRRVAQPNAKAGPSRTRTRVDIDLTHDDSASTNATGQDGSDAPAVKKRKITIPPPSYAIIHKQHQQIALPSKEPHPLLRPNMVFAGVYLPPPRKHARQSEEPARDAGGDDEAEEEEEREEEPMHVRTNGLARGSRVSAPSSPESPRRLEAVVVRSARAVKASWGRTAHREVVPDSDDGE